MNEVKTMSFLSEEKCIGEYVIPGAIVRFGRRKKKWVVRKAFSEEDGRRLLLCLDEMSSRENPCAQREISFPLKFVTSIQGSILKLELPKKASITIELPVLHTNEILAFAA